MPLPFKYLTLNYPFPLFWWCFFAPLSRSLRRLPFGEGQTPPGEEDNSEVTGLGTLTAPVWGPKISARSGQGLGRGQGDFVPGQG